MTLIARFGPGVRILQPVACLATDTVGKWMAIRGDRVNGKWRVERADPRDETKMPAVGVLVSKSTPTVGVMHMFGPLRDFYLGLNFGKSYFIGDNGVLSETLPTVLPGGYALVQKVGESMSSDLLWVAGDLGVIKRVG